MGVCQISYNPADATSCQILQPTVGEGRGRRETYPPGSVILHLDPPHFGPFPQFTDHLFTGFFGHQLLENHIALFIQLFLDLR